MFTVLSSWPIAIARVHPVHLDECRSARRAAADPPTKPTDLGVESACIWRKNQAMHDLNTVCIHPYSAFSTSQFSEGKLFPNAKVWFFYNTEILPDTQTTVSKSNTLNTLLLLINKNVLKLFGNYRRITVHHVLTTGHLQYYYSYICDYKQSYSLQHFIWRSRFSLGSSYYLE